MGILYLGAGAQAQVNPGTELTLSPPSGVVVGDVLFAVVNGSASDTVFNMPIGWVTLLHKKELNVYYKVAGVGDPATHLWTSDVSHNKQGIIIAYRGLLGGDLQDAEADFEEADAARTISNAPGVTTTRKNDLIILFLQADGDPGALVVPTGFTERIDNLNTPADDLMHVCDKIQTAVGATGSFDYTHTSTSDEFELCTFAAKQANLNKSHLAIGVL